MTFSLYYLKQFNCFCGYNRIQLYYTEHLLGTWYIVWCFNAYYDKIVYNSVRNYVDLFFVD